MISGFKKAHQTEILEIDLPSKEQVRRGFEALKTARDKAIYLFYATTGLRRTEVLELNRFEDIDYKLRAVKSKRDTRTKKAGITFYNAECEYWLKRYLDSRKDDLEKLFKIGWGEPFQRLWKEISKKVGVKITPQILRKWHATMLGELGVPDRYVDIFQGRAPKSVLAKFYTGKELKRLKRIYDKANLRILT